VQPGKEAALNLNANIQSTGWFLPAIGVGAVSGALLVMLRVLLS
jgi:hypothetical protein